MGSRLPVQRRKVNPKTEAQKVVTAPKKAGKNVKASENVEKVKLKKPAKQKLKFCQKSSDDESSSSSAESMKLESDYDLDDDWETECLFCFTKYKDDGSGEQWVQCLKCRRWAHELCGADDVQFVCTMCQKVNKQGIIIKQ